VLDYVAIASIGADRGLQLSSQIGQRNGVPLLDHWRARPKRSTMAWTYSYSRSLKHRSLSGVRLPALFHCKDAWLVQLSTRVEIQHTTKAVQ
jgi:hypothetical protein